MKDNFQISELKILPKYENGAIMLKPGYDGWLEITNAKGLQVTLEDEEFRPRYASNSRGINLIKCDAAPRKIVVDLGPDGAKMHFSYKIEEELEKRTDEDLLKLIEKITGVLLKRKDLNSSEF